MSRWSRFLELGRFLSDVENLVVLEKRRFICRKAQGWNLLNLVLLRHKLKILLESSLFLGLDRGLGGSLHHLAGRLVLLENLGL
jgi:hypothetical protein